jgi:acyl-CoA thioesterase I
MSMAQLILSIVLRNRLALTLLVCVLSFGAERVLAMPQGGKLVVLGSSTAAGTGASSPNRSWVGQLSSWLDKQHSMAVKNFAVPGALTTVALCTNTAGLKEKETWFALQSVDRAIATGATHLILAFPSNDATAGLPASTTIANLMKIRQCAHAASLKVAVLSTLPRSGLTAEQKRTVSDVDTQVRQMFASCYIDVYAALAETGSQEPARTLSAGDGVHYNDRGHAVIYSAVRRFIESGSCF